MIVSCHKTALYYIKYTKKCVRMAELYVMKQSSISCHQFAPWMDRFFMILIPTVTPK